MFFLGRHIWLRSKPTHEHVPTAITNNDRFALIKANQNQESLHTCDEMFTLALQVVPIETLSPSQAWSVEKPNQVVLA